MTIAEAIARVDAVKPNAFDDAEKIRWLSALDGTIHREIVETHESGEAVFSGYNENTDPMTALCVPFPYDILYLRYLEMQIDYANEDYTKYNNSASVFNEAYSSFERYYNRKHLPFGRKLKLFS